MARNEHKTEAIANADAQLNNVGLPTYTELLLALSNIVGDASVRGSVHYNDWRMVDAETLCQSAT